MSGIGSLRVMTRAFWITMVLLGVPRVVLACPVCFGQNDSPMSIAMNDGIMFMLGVIVTTLAGFGAFIVYLIRRAAAMEPVDVLTVASIGSSRPRERAAEC